MSKVIQICQQGNEQAFLQWLSQQADPKRAVEYTDKQGWSALHHAVLGGSTKIVKAIVQNGGNVIAENRERNTPLNLALTMINKPESAEEIASVLLKKMRELKAFPRKNREGNYPLHLACRAGYPDLVRIIHEMYPDTVYVINDQGMSPLGIAVAENKKEVVDVLMSVTVQSPLQFKDFKALFPTYKGSDKHSLSPPVHIYLVGDHDSGKSTLIRSLESDSFQERFWGIAWNTQNVPNNKGGLIPNDVTSRKLGRVIFFDLASGPQFIHENLIESSKDLARSLFIIVIDGRPKKKQMECRLEFWMSFINVQCKNLVSATSFRPNVLVVASYRDYAKPLRNDPAIRLRLVYRAVTNSNRELASSLNLLGNISLDCRKAQSPGLDSIRSLLHKQCAMLRPDENQFNPLHSLCYVLSEVFRLLEEDDEIVVPAITLEDLSDKVQEKSSQQDPSLFDLLPQDTSQLLELCENLEERERILIVKSSTGDRSTWIIYGKQKLACLIDEAFTQFSATRQIMPGNIAMLIRESLEECLASLSTLSMDILIDKLLEYFKFHDPSFQSIISTIAEEENQLEEEYLHFLPTILPSKTIEQWEIEDEHAFAWRLLPASDQEYSCFQPRFLMSLLLTLYYKCYQFNELISFQRRDLWSEGVLFEADDMEVCVMVNSKAITINMHYNHNKEIPMLQLRNMIRKQIEEQRRQLQPQTKLDESMESIVFKDVERLPISSPSSPKKSFRLQEVKKNIIRECSLSLASTSSLNTISSLPLSTKSKEVELQETLPFFEPCLSLCNLDSASLQHLLDLQHASEQMDPPFLNKLKKCLGPTYYQGFALNFNLPVHDQANTPSIASESEVSVVKEPSSLDCHFLGGIFSSDFSSCTTYSQLLEHLDSISIFRTREFFQQIENVKISRSLTPSVNSSLEETSQVTTRSTTSTPESRRLIPFTTRLPSQNYSRTNFSDVHFVDSIQVFSCPSSGGKFHSKPNGVTLTIPEGAIPPSNSPINVEFGVALVGRFDLPKDITPVSPFMWFCVEKQNFSFSKPIEISLPHFMNCASESDCNNLVFMKVDHNMTVADEGKFVFKESKGKAVFKPLSNHGVLSTKHSCFMLCIGCSEPESVVTKAKYCLIKIRKPKEFQDNKGELTFCTTYFLETCFESVQRQFPEEEIIKKMISLKPANDQHSEPEICINYSFLNDQSGGWVVGNVEGDWNITATDIQFWNRDIDQMQILHSHKMYPPRFTIKVNGTEATSISRLDVDFTGLKKKVQFQVFLEPSADSVVRRRQSRQSSLSSIPESVKPPGSSINILDRYIMDLNKYLNLDKIRPYLQSKGTISTADLERQVNLIINPSVSRNAIILDLVNILKGKGDEGLVTFVRGLEATQDGTGHVTIVKAFKEDPEYKEIEWRNEVYERNFEQSSNLKVQAVKDMEIGISPEESFTIDTLVLQDGGHKRLHVEQNIDSLLSLQDKAFKVFLRCCQKQKSVISHYYRFAENITHIPFIDPVTVLVCDHHGIEYSIRDHHITLKIPEGAIPRGKVVYIELAVALYGPFVFPDNTRPISPILWLCPQEDIEFKSPIEVTLPHFLIDVTQQELTQLRVTFAKANHNNYSGSKENNSAVFNFELCSLQPQFSANEKQGFGTLKTKHCCFYCLTANQCPELARKAGFLFTRIDYKSISLTYVVVFCVTFCLPSCLKALADHYHRSKIVDRRSTQFKFQEWSDGTDQHLTVGIPLPLLKYSADLHPKHGSIKMSDVDFWVQGFDVHQMEFKHKHKLYPPIITVNWRSVGEEHEHCIIPVTITGCAVPGVLDSDILLPLVSRSPCPAFAGYLHSSQENVLTEIEHLKIYKYLHPLDNEDLILLGQALGLLQSKLKKMKSLPAGMIDAWLNKEDNVLERSGPPTWNSLCMALKEIGQNGKADEIEQKV